MLSPDPQILPRSPKHALQLQRSAARVAALHDRLQQCFPHPCPPITLEIGCGHGHFLTAYAQAFPAVPALGIDLVSKRLERAQRKKDKRALPLLHFLKAEVAELMRAWPGYLSVRDCFILFPDPWPKQRHQKNRIVQPALLDWLAAVSTSDTRLHFRSDHPVAFDWARDTVAASLCWSVDHQYPWPFEASSYFQELMDSFSSFSALKRP